MWQDEELEAAAPLKYPSREYVTDHSTTLERTFNTLPKHTHARTHTRMHACIKSLYMPRLNAVAVSFDFPGPSGWDRQADECLLSGCLENKLSL